MLRKSIRFQVFVLSVSSGIFFLPVLGAVVTADLKVSTACYVGVEVALKGFLPSTVQSQIFISRFADMTPLSTSSGHQQRVQALPEFDPLPGYQNVLL
jgi:hypothetical protein